MFDHDIDAKGFSSRLFILQLIGAPLGGLIVGLVAVLFLEAVFGVKDSNLMVYVSYSLEGFLLGYVTQTAMPRAYESGGRWVWIPPVSIFTWGAIDELSLRPSSAIIDTIWPGKGSGAAYYIVLVLGPAIASCFYSFGVSAANRPPRTSLGESLRKALFHGPKGRPD